VLIIATLIIGIGWKFYVKVPPTKNNIILLFIKILIVKLKINPKKESTKQLFLKKDFGNFFVNSKEKYGEENVEDFKQFLKVVVTLAPLSIFWTLYGFFFFKIQKINILQDGFF
jgi:hypothetical protein